jgi:hypothetical protein
MKTLLGDDIDQAPTLGYARRTMAALRASNSAGRATGRASSSLAQPATVAESITPAGSTLTAVGSTALEAARRGALKGLMP